MAESHIVTDIDVADLDLTQRFVRVTGEREDKFVEFDYSIGEPEIFFEMILTHESFTEFCELNNVQVLPTDFVPKQTSTDLDWRISQARDIRFKTNLEQ